jgi:hypothetical protein
MFKAERVRSRHPLLEIYYDEDATGVPSPERTVPRFPVLQTEVNTWATFSYPESSQIPEQVEVLSTDDTLETEVINPTQFRVRALKTGSHHVMIKVSFVGGKRVEVKPLTIEAHSGVPNIWLKTSSVEMTKPDQEKVIDIFIQSPNHFDCPAVIVAQSKNTSSPLVKVAVKQPELVSLSDSQSLPKTAIFKTSLKVAALTTGEGVLRVRFSGNNWQTHTDIFIRNAFAESSDGPSSQDGTVLTVLNVLAESPLSGD